MLRRDDTHGSLMRSSFHAAGCEGVRALGGDALVSLSSRRPCAATTPGFVCRFRRPKCMLCTGRADVPANKSRKNRLAAASIHGGGHAGRNDVESSGAGGVGGGRRRASASPIDRKILQGTNNHVGRRLRRWRILRAVRASRRAVSPEVHTRKSEHRHPAQSQGRRTASRELRPQRGGEGRHRDLHDPAERPRVPRSCNRPASSSTSSSGTGSETWRRYAA